MILTADTLQASTGSTAGRAAAWLDPLKLACALFTIDTPARLAAFLAQVGHETDGLAYSREIWGPTATQRGYEGRADLGNTEAGDGFRFLGRGCFQVTGRANYAATRDGLRKFLQDVPDFEARPELLELPQWAALSAGLFWHSRGLDLYADRGAFETITRRINGGLNGYAHRCALYDAARKAFA